MRSMIVRKISLMSLIALLALIVFSGVKQSGAVQATPTPPPLLKSDKYLNDTSSISADPCGPPCFANITPGKTTLTDALAILKADKRFSNIVQPPNQSTQAIWSTAAGEACCQLVADAAGVVESILIKLAPNVTAKQLLDKYGSPAYISTVDYTPQEVALGMIYPKLGLVAWITPGDASTSILADNPVVIALYQAPDQLNKLIQTSSLQGWDGFKSYAAYKSAPPIITPLPPPTLPPQPTVAASTEDQKSLCYNAAPPTTQPPADAPKQFSAPQQVIDPTHTYCAFLTTEHGVIIIELYANIAPKHVNSFVFLASQGFYDGITWHRVIPGFVAQTGDPTASGSGGPGYTVPLEASASVKYDRPGILGMARTNDPNSAGSQFFITYAPLTNLDAGPGSPGYTIFGRVVRGMEIVQQIRARDQGEPPGDKLISVRTLDATTGK